MYLTETKGVLWNMTSSSDYTVNDQDSESTIIKHLTQLKLAALFRCGILCLAQLWSRFRNRSHRFSVLRILLIRQEKHTKIAKSVHRECCISWKKKALQSFPLILERCDEPRLCSWHFEHGFGPVIDSARANVQYQSAQKTPHTSIWFILGLFNSSL